MVIGLFIQVDWHWHWPKIWPMVSGAIHAAEQAGAKILIYSDSGATDLSEVTDSRQLASAYGYAKPLVDGFVLTFPSPAFLRYAQQLHGSGTPVVTIGRRVGEVPCVLCDNHEAIRQAVLRLAGRGHRDIAFMRGPVGNLCSDERLRGYLDGMREAGLVPSEPMAVEGALYESAEGQSVVAHRLKEGPSFTALVAFNDSLAIGAMDAIRAAGRRVPEDVEVVGFDNIPRAHWSSPPVSTYEMQVFHLGHLAATKLISRIRGEAVPRESMLPAQYFPRGSTRGEAIRDGGLFRLRSDWTEGAFYCEAQMADLRADAEASRWMDQLRQCHSGPDLLLVLDRLVQCALRLGISVTILYPLLDEGLAAAASLTGRELRAIYDLVSAAAVNEQKKQIEARILFAASSLPLREASFEAAEERAVVQRMQKVLAELKVSRAGLFLGSGEADPSEGRWWSFAHPEEQPARIAEPDLHAFLEKHGDAHAFFVMLVHYDGRQFGLVVLDAASTSLLHYPELVGQLSNALHAVRMRRALLAANRELVEMSRLAGIAEMATGVLHNIGNALNSVNTSANVAADRLRRSKIGNVIRVGEMLAARRGDLAHFLTHDPQGSILIDYLGRLGLSLEEERLAGIREFDALREKIEHLNEIVAAQQEYAQVPSIVEDVQPAELVEHALRICLDPGALLEIEIVRDFRPVGTLRVQRQKALQILVNLLNNAKDAVLDADVASRRRIQISVEPGDGGFVCITVADTGTGIDPANLTRIFAFGFTTKPGGHGFGLHSSALAAKEMGGTLHARSNGIGQGAAFVLRLPLGSPFQPEENAPGLQPA